MYTLTLVIFDQTFNFTDKSLKIVVSNAVRELEKTDNQWTRKARVLIRKRLLFFRIDTDAKISCQLTKI